MNPCIVCEDFEEKTDKRLKRKMCQCIPTLNYRNLNYKDPLLLHEGQGKVCMVLN